jgi:hypothetical protein
VECSVDSIVYISQTECKLNDFHEQRATVPSGASELFGVVSKVVRTVTKASLALNFSPTFHDRCCSVQQP